MFADGMAVVDCTSAITAAVGKIVCELRISEGDTTVGTANFAMIVEAAPLAGYIASGDDFSAMQQVLDGTQKAAASAAASATAAKVAAAIAQVQAGMAYKIAATAAAMTDTSIGYVYTGNETGYVNGGWYYYNGSAWTLGGTSVDPTLSVAGAAADAAACGDLKRAFNTGLTETAFAPGITKGSYWNSDGSIGSSNKFARTTGKWYGAGARNAICLESDIYEFGLYFYDENDTSAGGVTRGSTTLAYIPGVYRFVINYHKKDNTDITDSDVTAIRGLQKCYAITDTSFSKSDIPADAKATGDRFGDDEQKIEYNKQILDLNEYVPIIIESYESGSIKYTDGSELSSSSSKRTDYIDISSYKYVKYKRQGFTDTHINTGIAFYDSEKTYIIGLSNEKGQDATGYLEEMQTVLVPNGAKYIRCPAFADTTTYGNFELYGESILHYNMTTFDRSSSAALKGFADTVYIGKKESAISLSSKTMSFSTGDISESQSGRFCTSGFVSYNTDLKLSLNLDNYWWHCWSYKRNSDSYASHSNTNKMLADGAIPIFVKKEIYDSFFVIEIRRKDGAVLTTDTDDPTSDYSIIMNALKISNASVVLNNITDGYIFRLSDNPDPVPIGSSAVGYSSFLSQTWDTFLTDYSTEVTKTKIGVSSTTESVTTEYDIYKYVFTPRDYERTVFLSAGCHGDEYEGFWGLYRLMRMIYDEGYKYPNLRQLRHRVRFVIVPVWNPWGVQNRQRNCPLGFPPQENINTSVTVDGTTYPAFTSKECQAIKAIFDGYDGELDLWIDYHTDPLSPQRGDKKGCYGYAADKSSINRILYGLTVDFHNIIKAETAYSTNITIYNTNTFSEIREPGYGMSRGVPSAVIETTINEYAESGSALLMKYTQEWYGNILAGFVSTI